MHPLAVQRSPTDDFLLCLVSFSLLSGFCSQAHPEHMAERLQIYTHKDEGANVWDGKEEAWKPNYHAHMIFDWTDGHTGKTVKLNRHDMAEMQTITAECLENLAILS